MAEDYMQSERYQKWKVFAYWATHTANWRMRRLCFSTMASMDDHYGPRLDDPDADENGEPNENSK